MKATSPETTAPAKQSSAQTFEEQELLSSSASVAGEETEEEPSAILSRFVE